MESVNRTSRICETIAGFGRSGIERSGIGRSGIERSGIGRSGIGRSEIRRSGIGRSGIGRSGIGMSGIGRYGIGRSGIGRLESAGLESGVLESGGWNRQFFYFHVSSIVSGRFLRTVIWRTSVAGIDSIVQLTCHFLYPAAASVPACQPPHAQHRIQRTPQN